MIRSHPVADAGEVDDETAPFYQLDAFKLYKRNPLAFPRHLAISSNYFNSKWTGERRLKNVVAVLEYVPDQSRIQRINSAEELSEIQHDDFGAEFSAGVSAGVGGGGGGGGPADPRAVMRQMSVEMGGTGTSSERAFELFNLVNTEGGGLSPAILNHVLHVSMGKCFDAKEIKELFDSFSEQGVFTQDSFQKLLMSDKLRPREKGRYFVALSLAEAETVRRIMHVNGASIGVEMRLRLLPADFATVDHLTATSIVVPRDDQGATEEYMAVETKQCLRYFDGEMTFTEQDIGVLVRALQRSTCRRRTIFFENVLGCRRRLRQKWESSALAKVFSLRSEFHLLKQRAEVVRMRLAIHAAALTLYEAFQAINSSKNGLLKPAELYGAMDFLGIAGVNETDIIDVFRVSDADGDGNLSFGEFAAMLRYNDEILDGLDKALEESGMLPVVPVDVATLELAPKGEEAIKVLWKSLDDEQARKAEEETQEYKSLENARKRELEEEQDRLDRDNGIGPNPELGPGYAAYDFTVSKLPKKVQGYGVLDFRKEVGGTNSLFADKKSYVVIPLPEHFTGNGGGSRLNQYTLSMYVRFNKRPAVQASLFRTSPLNGSELGTEIVFDAQGCIGNAVGTDEMFGRMPLAQWVHMVITCSAGSELKVYINGQSLVGMMYDNFPDLLCPDGPLSLSVKEGIALFAADVETKMCGGLVRNVTIYDKAMNQYEVDGVCDKMRDVGAWQCAECTARNGWDDTECKMCKRPKPSGGSGGGGGGGGPGDGDDEPVSPSSNLRMMAQAMGYTVTNEMVEAAMLESGHDEQMAMGLLIDKAVSMM